MYSFLFIFGLFTATCSLENKENVTIDHFLDLINSRQSSWRAGKLFRANFTTKQLTRSNDLSPVVVEKNVWTKPCTLQGVKIPEFFDAREHWSQCRDIIGKIRDQGFCYSCWAFTSTAVMSDRMCIKTDGKVKVELSAEELISCCSYCSNNTCTNGLPINAWHYWTHHGIVSGGGFSSFKGCKPYQESEYYYKTPSSCVSSCTNPGYNISYAEDKYYGLEYYMVNKEPECIQVEILQNGPVHASMVVYEDFSFYRDGVYFYTVGGKMSRHGVKIVGWGVEKGTPYWLVANSWGCSWSNLGGFFKIRRGNDECGIENHVIGGLPKIKTNQANEEYSWGSNVVLIGGIVGGLVAGILIMVGVVMVKMKIVGGSDILSKYFRFK